MQSFQVQSSQNKCVKLSEKKIQELRLLAYEYVKQIVAKANDLSQNKSINYENIPTNQSDRQPTRLEDSTVVSREIIQIDPANMRAIREAAVQINKQFRFSNGPSTREQMKTKTVTYKDSAHATQPYAKVTQTIVRADTKYSTTTTAITDPVLTRDYIEQDYATMSSSQDENDSRTDANKSDPITDRTRSRFKGIHERLNWHLFVSCFSTCLPENFTRQRASNSGANIGPSAL